MELLLLLCTFLLCHTRTTTTPLRSLVDNILSLRRSDLYLISDLSSPSQIAFLTDTMEAGQQPMHVILLANETSIPDLGMDHALSPSAGCNELPSKYRYWYRKNAILTVVWVSGNKLISVVLSLLSATVARCQSEIRTGIYYRDNMLLFFVDDHDKTQGSTTIFADELVQKFKNAAIIHPDRQRPEDLLLISNYNLFGNSTVLGTLYNSSSTGLASLSTVFPVFPMAGYQLRLEGLPYAYHMTADTVPNPPSPTQQFTNDSGYEIDMLKSLARILNFTYDIRNPEDMGWGNLKDGPGGGQKWSGMTACIAEARCDLIISCVGISSNRLKVVLPSVAIDSDSLVFAAPLPQAYFNVFTLVHPLSYPVWISTLVALTLTALTVYLVSSKLFRWYGLNNKEWATVFKAFWYTFGMLVVQDVTRHSEIEDKPNQSFALRIAIAPWLLSCVLLEAGYSGTLTSFLTTPTYGKAIETFQDVIKSGLSWDFVSYGAEVEAFLATTDDSVWSVIWRDKILASYESDTHSRLENVSHHKMIATEWHNELEAQSYIGFSTPNGQPLLHVSQHYITSRPSGWAFYPLNPYFQRFDAIFLNMVEAGLIDEWKRRTMVDMKRQSLASNTTTEHKDKEEEEEPKQILLDDVRGIFVALAFGLGLALAGALAELGLAAMVEKSRLPDSQMKVNVLAY